MKHFTAAPVSLALVAFFASPAFSQSNSTSSHSGSATASGTASGSSAAPSSASNATSSTNSTSTATTASSNPLIPSTVSGTCQSFLAALNSDDAITACTKPLLNAISVFSPTLGSSTPTASVQDTLDTMCTSGQVAVCSDDLIRDNLGYFSGNCSTELSGGADGDVVRNAYDVLYSIQPMRSALCAQDTTTKSYCLLEIASGTSPSAGSSSSSIPTSPGTGNSTSTAASNSTSTLANSTTEAVVSSTGNFNIQTYAGVAMIPANLFYTVTSQTVAAASRLLKRQSSTSDDGPAQLPNATTFRVANIPYNFLSSSMGSSMICTQCTKTIISRYIAFEASIPYVSGLTSSGMLGGQTDFWDALSNTCGSGFTGTIEQGSIPGGLSGGAERVGGMGRIVSGGLAVVVAIAIAMV